MFIKKVISSIPKSVLDTCKNNMTSAARPVSDSIMKKYVKPAISPAALEKICKTTSNSAAKITCVSALKGSNPREAVCIVDKASGKVLSTAFGDAESCVFDLGVKGLKGRDLILYHGHAPLPNGKTLPVSLQDFLVMNDSNIEKIVAFDSRGNQSFLKKNPQFVTLNKSQVNALKSEYRRALLKGSKSSDSAKIKELLEYVKAHPDATGVKVEIIERLNALQKSSSAKDIIDRFWRLNANKYNLTYFSEL